MSSTNFADSIDYFLDRHAKERLIAKGYISNYTQENYAGHLRRLGRFVAGTLCAQNEPKVWRTLKKEHQEEKVLDKFETLTVEEITRDLVEDYLVSRSKDEMKPATLNAELYCYRSYFKLLSKRFAEIENILDGLERSRYKKTESKHLVETHVKIFLEYLEEIDRSDHYQARNALFFDVLIKTGCRISEGLTLKMDSIIFRADAVVCVFFGKGGKTREVPLPYGNNASKLVSNRVFSENLKYFMEVQRKAFLKGKESEFIFLSNRGTRWSDDQARIMFDAVMKELDLTTYDYTPHSLRHSVATHLLYNGVPEREVATILGHASPTVTNQIYSHTEDSKIQKGMTLGY